MTRRALSARAAGQYLGFKSANPILAAIANGELQATQRPGSRNGRNTHSFLIQPAELDRWAASRGLELPGADSADGAPKPEPTTPEPESAVESNVSPFEMIRELHIPFRSGKQQIAEPPSPAFTAGVLGVVTIPTEHYAALVAARAELEFLRANFELTYRGPISQQKGKPASREFGVESDELLNSPARYAESVRQAAYAEAGREPTSATPRRRARGARAAKIAGAQSSALSAVERITAHSSASESS